MKTALQRVSLRQTCITCPSQWEGELNDGTVFYVRYRFNRLTIQVGDTVWAASANAPVVTEMMHPEHEMDGYLQWEEVEEHFDHALYILSGLKYDRGDCHPQFRERKLAEMQAAKEAKRKT